MRKAYESRFRALLQKAGARRLESGVQRILALAQTRADARNISPAVALAHAHDRLAGHPFFRKAVPSADSTRFFCDAGLGGLARWLRACGYDALWEPGIEDSELLRRAETLGCVVITTDSMLMERGVVRDGIIPALWLPPILSIREQLGQVFREFGLTFRAPRCMACGGNLIHADKEALREQIPPRTYRWLDEYFVCSRCGKLFWHGTHWEKIQNKLRLMEKP